MRRQGTSNKNGIVTFSPRKEVFIIKHYAGGLASLGHLILFDSISFDLFRFNLN